MCSEFCFFIKLARPISFNLVHRLSDEMADLNANIKQKIFKNISFRFPGSFRCDQSLEVIAELPETHLDLITRRPLPLLPSEEEEYFQKFPWFKQVDRIQGEKLVEEGDDGFFLVRPSSHGQNFLTLTLWFQLRHYNIPIRRRTDGKFALGSPKDNEKTFYSVEEMISYYRKEKLILYTNNQEAGSTCLTSYP